MRSLHRKIKYKLIKDPKLSLIVLLGIAFLIISYFLFFSGDLVSVNIEDKCGRFVNLFSHTIANEETCKLRCESQCDSMQMSYKKVRFSSSSSGCNKCECLCK